jgi:hypothetical protein
MKGPAIDGASYEPSASTVLSFAGDLPIAHLSKGDFLVELQATDPADHCTPMRTPHFHNRMRALIDHLRQVYSVEGVDDGI